MGLSLGPPHRPAGGAAPGPGGGGGWAAAAAGTVGTYHRREEEEEEEEGKGADADADADADATGKGGGGRKKRRTTGTRTRKNVEEGEEGKRTKERRKKKKKKKEKRRREGPGEAEEDEPGVSRKPNLLDLAVPAPGGGADRGGGRPRGQEPGAPIDAEAFEGMDGSGLRNAGQSPEALRYFLGRVRAAAGGAGAGAAEGAALVAWTMVYLDGECTTPLLPAARRYCTDKGPRCQRWNCTCDGQIRALQASAPLLGAMFVVPPPPPGGEVGNLDGGHGDGDGDGDGGPHCYLLPLGPTVNEEGDAPAAEPGFERTALWPATPFHCGTTLRQRWDALGSVLRDRAVRCVTYNAAVGLMPYHYHREHDGGAGAGAGPGTDDLILPSIWDLRLVAWILQPNSTDAQLEFAAMWDGFSHLGQAQGRGREEPPPPEHASAQLLGLLKARESLEFLLALHPIMDRQLTQKGLRSAFDEIESPAQSILSAMECHGVGFFPEHLGNLQSQLEGRIAELSEEARGIARDRAFLLSSPQQVAHLLFDVMRIKAPQGLASKQVAGSQHRSTSEEALRAIQEEAKRLRQQPPRIVDVLLEFRNLNKLLTTYIRPLPQFAREATIPSRAKKKRSKRSRLGGDALGPPSVRIHPMWMQTAVRTGRLSCRKPNLQQVPTSTVFGINIRDSFRPTSKDRCLFACDYSQNEIRILAHVSNDQALIAMFNSRDDIDIYKQMSAAITGKRIEDIGDEERKVSKQVTLAILYGMGVNQISKKLGIVRQAAQQHLDAFYRRFHGVRRWMAETKEFARRNHYVTTITGRRRYLDDIQASDKGKVAQAERQAVNTIIQGSAADIMKLAMIKMSSRIMDWKRDFAGATAGGTGVSPKILLQIHDELLFEVAANDADIQRLKDAVLRCCADECVREFRIAVPLKLKCSCGSSWGSLDEI